MGLLWERTACLQRRLRSVVAGLGALVATTNAIAEPPEFWMSRGVGGGGALFGPSISPHDPREMYMGCDMSECFHTGDSGKTWRVLPFRQIQVGGFDNGVQFTSDPDVLYALDL